MTHAIQFLTTALKDVPASIFNSQLAAVDAVRTIFSNETINSNQSQISQSPLKKYQARPEKYRLPNSKGDQVEKPAIISKGVLKATVHTKQNIKKVTINKVDDQEHISRRTRSKKSNQPGISLKMASEPISQRTRSKTFEKQYTTPSHARALATHLLTHMANSVLEHETGKQLNYGQLRKHPRLQETWKTSFSNEKQSTRDQFQNGI